MVGALKFVAAIVATASLAGGLVIKRDDPSEGIPLDVNDATSIKNAASTVVYNMLKTYYVGNVTKSQEGLLPNPYYWWQAGAMFGGLVDYWAYTKDDSYTKEIGEGIFSQASETVDFNMLNQHYSMGNDDQGFWAFASMSALEEGLPVPDGAPSDLWYQLSVNTYNEMVERWQKETVCNGGLRWQVFSDNKGYDYKNTIANVCFMQLAARLSRYTGNSTYGDWADTVFTWLENTNLINTTSWLVADGSHIEDKCATVAPTYWSYNPAISIYSAAIMKNAGGSASDKWQQRLSGLLNTTIAHFFSPPDNKTATGVMFEAECEAQGTCNTDQYSFKAYLSRWLGKTALLAPELAPQIKPLLQASAAAAAQACSGHGNHTCGTKWYVGGFDGNQGFGQYLSAAETLQSLLVFTGDAPLPKTQGNATKA